MTALYMHKIAQPLLLFLVCAASVGIGFALRGPGENSLKSNSSLALKQSDEKIIDRKEFNGEPFVFGDLSVKRNKIDPGQKLSIRSLIENGGGTVDDWLENLEFTIKNAYDKSIVYMNFDILFPETGVDRPMMVYQMDQGIHPTSFEEKLKLSQPFTLNPGDVFTFKLTDKKLNAIREFLNQGGFQLTNLNKATIRIDTIYFADETKWSQGNMYKLLPGEKPAPGRPARYERIK